VGASMSTNCKLNILFFACDPGGANCVAACFKQIFSPTINCEVYGKNWAVAKFKLFNITCIDISDTSSKDDIRHLLETRRPDLIITGTSSDDFMERLLWEQSEQLGVPSIALLDQWMSYGVRFSKYKSISELDEYSADESKIVYLPSKIGVMDDYSVNEMIKEGIPGDRIVIVGQLYLNWLAHNKEAVLNGNGMRETNRRLDLRADEFNIIFFSEPISTVCKETLYTEDPYFGYNELTTYSVLKNSVDDLARKMNKKCRLVIKLHPKEEATEYLRYFDEAELDFIPGEVSGLDCLSIADMAIGFTSMALVEAWVLGVPICNLELAAKNKSVFVLDILGIKKRVTTVDQLKTELGDIITGSKNMEGDQSFLVKSDESIKNLVLELINYG
jgi:hypothetical protein